MSEHGIDSPEWLRATAAARAIARRDELYRMIVKAMQRTDGQYVYAAVQDPVGASLALVLE